jgi:hypothetical protein
VPREEHEVGWRGEPGGHDDDVDLRY